MKTKVLVLSVIVLLASVNLFSQQNRGNIYCNISESEKGITKEYTIFSKNTKKPISKRVYVYDNMGQRSYMSTSAWDNKKGWVEIQKHTFHYVNNKLMNKTYKERDIKADKWPNKSLNTVYTYDDGGQLLSIKNVSVEDIINNLLTQNTNGL